ncbi:MAG: hypothetical protein B9S34_03650 [Opitutia bacterium Tous-C1TDCM]|nr:MAG: hypothetical protein B9S34_03650 [Opitutae bacterium Tous-C1TDCM]
MLVLCLLGFVGGAPRLAGAILVEIKDGKGQPVADAVASLTPLDRTPVIKVPDEPAVIVQDNEEFSPVVTVVVVGGKVLIPNRDKVQHHVYSLSPAKRFDIPLYKGEMKEPVVFDRPGVVALGCNIHDWMAAYVVVLATPHFAKSAAAGNAQIGDLPPGRYRLEVWHQRITAPVVREVTVNSDPSTQVISVTLRELRQIRRAPETGGGAYR